MRALCLVAHPDDCAIFGYQFIMDHRDWDWHICYLTYKPDHRRSREMAAFWNARGIETQHLGVPDRWEFVKDGLLGFDPSDISSHLVDVCYGYDLLLTHNVVGEYKHPHHLFIHETVKHLDIPKVYFGTWPDHANRVIQIDAAPFSTDELPIHKSVIDGFDLTNWKYFVTPEAENLVKYTHE